ncbi:unnamed protein product [Xylocopa violacea]|uniref:Calcineurin-like phosphoesterase domain-containing protein n=1 Tax=Xylocopa violacea TaxID=135666 RepID=A0ABP1N4L0_XYLVO
MVDTRTNSKLRYVIEIAVALTCVLLFCEYILTYIILKQCYWPALDPNKVDVTIPPPDPDEAPIRAMFISDTHLLGPKRGHWFDKLKREFQMYRAFQTLITLHRPELIFILGDLFDEGEWSDPAEFEEYLRRFHALFAVPKDMYLHVVAGNHDIGFHYATTPYLSQRFEDSFKAQSVTIISFKGNYFVLLNSIAMEGDGCFLCRPMELGLKKISSYLNCTKDMKSNCNKTSTITRYSRPIILQHYPMYRESDAICNEPDQAPDEIKNIKFRERWECLSKEASGQLLDIMNPRLVVNGHTHHGCTRLHRKDILEYTIPSFNWRNKDNPSILLGIFTPNNFSVAKCYMPVESTEIDLYNCAKN